ncbi:MAG: phenylacetate--CoA ligase family protein [Bacteroidia bacterium]|nr:phenylacetate--CoA ligase family protein [Bacteroidia bacterium]MBP9688508.1 phenylacetate--CoA ligase family protein [Bacteroidia bacterium]
MSINKNTIYNLLPHKLKELAAGIYSKKMMRFRKNETSPKRINKAAEREKMTFVEWQQYQQNELEMVLERAITNVPYYRNYWNKRGIENNEWKILTNWPILTKDEVRENNHLFLADDCKPNLMYTEYTSGTSGTPLKMFWSKETTLEYYSIYERRIKNWHQVNWDMKYLMLGGRIVIPTTQIKPPFWVRNKYMNQLYMSSYHLSEKNIDAYIEAINKYKPEYMLGYASSMYSLALLVKQFNKKLPKLKCAISNAEPLLDHQRELIEEVFNCKMVNTYGMSELVAGASTYDDINEYVIWPEVGKVEILDFESDRVLKDGEVGRIVCTSLLNKDMPLIRYETGDSGSILKSTTGINHYKINELTGRIDDLVITKDGRRIGRLDPVFKKDFNIREAQIIQNTLDKFTIKVVPTENYNKQNELELAESLMERVGKCDITFEQVDSIPRTNTGKFKAVISHVKK